jgi:anti-sigma-K factor RskA
MRLRRPEPHTLAGAYALDALTGPDRARFERHLATCPACAGEQRGWREVTARLAAAVAAEPPAELIGRAVAAAAQTRQQPPLTGEAWARWRDRPVRPAARARRNPLPRWGWPAPRTLAPVLAAVFLAAAVVSGVVAVTAEHRLGAAQRSAQEITAVLTAPDAVMLTSRVTGGGTATVVMSHRERSLVFTTDGLPRLPAGRSYQLWLMGPRGDRSVGMLSLAGARMTGPVIATGLAAGDRVGLTVEPAGGMPHPTSRPILMLSLTT